MNTPETAPANAPDYPQEFWLRTLLRWYIGLIIRPTPTIREIVERRPVWAGLGTAIGGSAISIAAYVVAYQLLEYQSLSIDQLNSGDVSVPPIGIAMWCILILNAYALWSLVLHWIARRFGGHGNYLTVFSAMLVISVVFYAVFFSGILAASLTISPGSSNIFKDALHTVTNVSLALTVVGLLWVSSLATLLVKEHHDLEMAQAALAVAVSIIPTFILGYALLLVLILAALFAGLASFG